MLERGWLSSNNIVFTGPGPTAVVDSGYATHAAQTVRLVDSALGGQPLSLLLNTHLHSDHCGGNAALQSAHPKVQTLIPPGQADQVRNWDPEALTYIPTGQECPRFLIDGVLEPGAELILGSRSWQVHAAPGHDQHSVILFEPVSRTLISADALWQNGFGVVFQELEGESAFAEVARTLELIEALNPALVIPGHGAVFDNIAGALTAARRRLDGFTQDPRRHAKHAAKVLLKFKALDVQQQTWPEFMAWVERTPYFGLVHQRWFGDVPFADWVLQLTDELTRSGALRLDGGRVINC